MKNICKAPNNAQCRATLYLGANIGDAYGAVTPDLFTRYLVDYIVPQFPGFTVTTGDGYWKGKPELVRMVHILMMDTDAARNEIRQFAERYKTEFQQEAVAYEFAPVEFSLDCWPFGPVKAYHTPGKGY